MQDIHAIGGGGRGGRFFGGGGDRRLRPQNHTAAALKCPRCDSLNTKFCYYNNYNLSQPRHYCKGCRRYWTKGGVLRNVPVGGGCRKTKRSKPKSDTDRESRSKDQSSSSESTSCLAPATTAASPKSVADDVTVVKEGSVPSNTTSDTSVVYNFPDFKLYNLINPPSFDQQSTDGQISTTELGSFTNLITSSENMMGFGLGNIATASFHSSAENQGSGKRTTPAVEITGGISNDGLTAELDWGDGGGGNSGGQELFDLTAAVWSQTQWTDNNQSLNNYLP